MFRLLLTRARRIPRTGSRASNNRRWVNQACLGLTALESRVTPCSLLAPDLDLSMLADSASGTEERTTLLDVLSLRTRHSENTQNIRIAFIPQGDAVAGEANVTSPSSDVTPIASHPNAVSSSNPAFHNANGGGQANPTTPPVTKTRTARAPQQDQPGIISVHGVRQQTVAPVRAVAVNLQPAAAPKVERHVCESSKMFAELFNSYEGTPGDDEVLGVASGKGPGNVGKAYSAGYHGTDGWLTRYGGGGACEVLASIPGVKVEGIAANTQGVYVVGTANDNQSAFVYKFDADLNVVASDGFGVIAGGELQLHGVGLSVNSTTPDVYLTGSLQDPSSGLGYRSTLVLRYDKGLTTQKYVKAFDFGSDSAGRSVAADRPNNAYIGARFRDPGLGDSPLTFRLDNDGLTVRWSQVWTHDATHNIDLRVGRSGAQFIGGTTNAGGIFYNMTMGWQSSFGTTPGAATMLALKLNPANGTFDGVTTYALTFYAASLGDVVGLDVAADRNGDAYLAAAVSESPALHPHDGRVYKLELATQTIIDAQNYGGPGPHDVVNGVDLITTAGTSEVIYGGLTTTPEGLMWPTPSGCDVTYNGALDGFVAKVVQDGKSKPQPWKVSGDGVQNGEQEIIKNAGKDGTTVVVNNGPGTVKVYVGDDLSVTLAPGSSTTISYKKGQTVTVRGEDGFTDASGTYTFPNVADNSPHPWKLEPQTSQDLIRKAEKDGSTTVVNNGPGTVTVRVDGENPVEIASGSSATVSYTAGQTVNATSADGASGTYTY